MISSLDAYRYAAASQLLSSSAASPSAPAPTSSPGGFARGGGVAAVGAVATGAIRQILAHAQIEAAASSTLGGPAAAPTAEADFTAASQPVALATPSPPPVQDAPPATITSMQDVSVGSLSRQTLVTNVSVASVATSAGSVDSFHLSISLGDQSVSVDLAALGIGALTQSQSSYAWSAGDGAYGVGLSLGLGTAEGTSANIETAVVGLTQAQAQSLAAAFQSASALPGQTTHDVQLSQPSANYDDHYANTTLASGDAVQFSTSVAENIGPAAASG